MYEYFKGEVIQVQPTAIVMEVGGIGYELKTTVYTYEQVSKLKNAKLYIHQIIKEDAHELFGFFTPEERAAFRALISISRIGGSIAQVILSTLTVNELQNAIIHNDVALLKSVKGVGAKAAQRLVLELQDKIGKIAPVAEASSEPGVAVNKPISDEALQALLALGFPKNQGEKAIQKVLKTNGKVETTEELLKLALKSI